MRISLDAARRDLTAVRPNVSADGAARLAGPVIPGVANAHSHAFQRALAGLGEAERAFAGWRAVMYRLANALTPEQLEAVSAQTYVELRKAGYTSLAEFHQPQDYQRRWPIRRRSWAGPWPCRWPLAVGDRGR